ncbi:hypothetical protein ACFLZN_02125, partial [Nanoarchaeota archaeon]
QPANSANLSKGIAPAFYIVPQNGEDLYYEPGFKELIDGIGIEDLWFDDNYVIPTDQVNERVGILKNVEADGKFVLVTDYPTTQENICDFYENCWQVPFACRVFHRDLKWSFAYDCDN